MVLLSSLGPIGYPATALAQERQGNAGGNVRPIPLPITQGEVIEPDLQRQLGLVTLNVGCSGTLLNRYWVLTARHCVAANGKIDGPLRPAEEMKVTATWAPGRIGIASRIHDFGRGSDVALFYLGYADLGQVDDQPIYAVARIPGFSPRVYGRLIPTDTVTQYGQGLSTFATGVYDGTPPAVPGSGLGVYRSARLRPSWITGTGYVLAMNGMGQVSHGGDSGGPTVVTVNGVGVGIAGVASTCHATGYVRNAPERSWYWATGIDFCVYASTEPFVTRIRNAIRETPRCLDDPACAIPAILSAAMRTAP